MTLKYSLTLSAAILLASATTTSAADFSTEVSARLNVVTDAYQFLHRNPETGKKEFKAQDYLKKKLIALGFTDFVDSKLAPTAVIAVLDTHRPGPVIALRAEMDGRPLEKDVTEPVAHNPRSEVPGFMHNCGHDAHAAILLGTAALVINNIDKFDGKIVFLFQPAEETAVGGDDIVNEGILPALGVTKIFAEHVAPGMAVGTVAMSPGASLAGSNTFALRLTGRSSHAAAPFEGDDVLLNAMKIAEEISLWPARRVDIANSPIIVSIYKFKSEPPPGALPAEVEIGGTIRAFADLTVADGGNPPIADRLNTLVTDLAKSYGLAAVWSLKPGSPPTYNDPQIVSDLGSKLPAVFPGTVDTRPWRGMFSEDFAYYGKTIPSLYMSLGIAKDGLGLANVHTPDFTIHPDAFRSGLTLMSLVAEIATTGGAAWH